MRIGIMAGVSGDRDGLDGLIDQIVIAERSGMKHCWLAHISSYGYDAVTALTLAATKTQTIELATGVVPVLPRHPMVLAQQALTAQSMAKGRFTLGIGPSHRPGVEETMGLSYDRPAAQMKEYLSVLRPLLDEGQVSFNGEFYNVSGEMSVGGSSPVSVVISALAPRMLRLAGEMADGTVTWMAGLKAIETHVAPRINKAAEGASRPRPRVCVALPVLVTDDTAAAKERAARTFESYGTLVNYRRILDIEGADGPADVAVIGDEAEVERRLRAFADAGATDFIASVMEDRSSIGRTWELVTGLARSSF